MLKYNEKEENYYHKCQIGVKSASEGKGLNGGQACGRVRVRMGIDTLRHRIIFLKLAEDKQIFKSIP